MFKREQLIAIAVVALLFAACHVTGNQTDVDSGNDGETGGDADADSDADTDSDTDSDTDTDIDADTDTDTDGDTETELDTETDQPEPDCDDITCPEICRAYVDGDVATSGDGKSWATAYKTVSGALDDMTILGRCCGPCQIWVAEGTYFTFVNGPQDTNQLHPGLELYGGFNGTETALEQRNWEGHRTVLDGHRAENSEDRVYHVVTCSDEARLDGFKVTGGRAQENYELENTKNGGGIYCQGTSPVIANCMVERNAARTTGDEMGSAGGGMYVTGGSPTILNTIFSHNTASAYSDAMGGGLFTSGGAPVIRDCVFQDNTAQNGGGAYFASGSPVVERTSFIYNSADGTAEISPSGYGGGVYRASGSVSFSSCLFTRNTAEPSVQSDGGSGGAFYGAAGSALFTNCTVANNTGMVSTGGIHDNNATVVNSIVRDNTNAQLVTDGSVTFSNIQGGPTDNGNIDADPLFEDPMVEKYRLLSGSPCIDAADGSLAPELDIDGNSRVDDPTTPNTGEGPPWADMGAYEFPPANDIVVDHNTELVWLREIPGTDYQWHESDDFCRTVIADTYTDWRMPSLEELEQIYPYVKALIPDVNTTDYFAARYWSADFAGYVIDDGEDQETYYVIHFDDGMTEEYFHWAELGVLCVHD